MIWHRVSISNELEQVNRMIVMEASSFYEKEWVHYSPTDGKKSRTAYQLFITAWIYFII